MKNKPEYVIRYGQNLGEYRTTTWKEACFAMKAIIDHGLQIRSVRREPRKEG